MIDIIVTVITAIAFGCLRYWAFRPAVRKWFEFPKYKMLEDERRFSEADKAREAREGDARGTD
jgi:cbb3-type cytochrome oxidase subunit 3